MKRVSNSTAADTNAVQPGDDDARTLENVADDHGGTSLDNTRDVLQAIPSDASLAPALPASRRASGPGHPCAGRRKRGAELADLRRSHIGVAGQAGSRKALLLALSRRADARVDRLRRFATGGICKLVVGHAGDVLLSYV